MRGSARGRFGARTAPRRGAPGSVLASRETPLRARTAREISGGAAPRGVARVTRRALVAALALLVGSLAAPVGAQERKVKVGVLKLTSSAPIFLGVERGTFREF